jgi:DNA repair photolyase|nr:MAG TPA: DNA repair photolyase [Caudoviricetes sp.]
MNNKTFNPLNVSSKFAICGLPIRVDTYKTCSFGCKYCFSNYRKIMEFEKQLQVANIKSVERKLDKILNKKEVNPENFLDVLISQGYDWHCGGMSDPFQPVEQKLQITKQLIDITNQYDIHILFSTKSDTTYNCDIKPELHTFQLSVTNTNDRVDFEPNVPDISKRYKFYKSLKERGFKVGIRIQPFIPDISTLDIIEKFKDADHFTIEGLKLVPQNKQHKDYLLELTGLHHSDFTQMGLLNLKPEIRNELYKPFIDKLQEYGISYSIADNDLHHLGTSKCCCGDTLIHKSTDFNNTSMICRYGINYTREQLNKELKRCSVDCCKCNQLFTSNRQEGCVTVQDFYNKRFDRKSSPFSPKFLYLN